MDESRFVQLLQDRCDGNKLDVEKLVVACRTYMDYEGPDELESSVKAVVTDCNNDSGNVAKVVLQTSTPAGAALKNILIKHCIKGKKDAKPVLSHLHTLVGEVLEDDDPDDSDSSDTANKPKSTMEPVMRGIIKKKEDNLIWAGKWALSKESFDKGDKQRFKMSYAGPEAPLDAKQPPKTGKWNGFFFVKGPSMLAVKVEEKGNMLNFSENTDSKGWIRVTGEGENMYGKFTVSGLFEPESGRMSLVKTYKRQDHDWVANEEGESEEDEIEDEDQNTMADELAGLKADAEEDIEEIRKRLLNGETHEPKKQKRNE